MSLLLVHAALLLAPILIAALWQSALLALATAALLHLLPTLSAAARSRIWTAAFLLAAVLPFASLSPAAPTATSAPTHSGIHATFAFAVALVSVWFLASALRAAQLFRSALHLHGIARRATPIPSPGSAKAEICTSTEVDVPSVAGFLHPRILIPTALFPTLSSEELHHIILHESEHLRRRDDWTNLLQKLALVLFPISPALLWMERRLCLERELACDDGVLRATGASRAYATTLTNLAEHGFLRRTLSLALGAIGSIRHRSEIARRVHRILARPAAQMPPRRAAIASGFALTAIFAAAFAFTHVPQLVFFTVRPAGLATTESASASPFHHARAFQPAFAHAVIPSPHPVLAVYHVKSAHANDVHRTKRRSQTVNAPVILRTSFRQSRTEPEIIRITRVRFTTNDAFPQFPVFTYAAVPVRSGWLILEL